MVFFFLFLNYYTYMIISRFIHVAANAIIFLFLWLSSIPLHMYICVCVYMCVYMYVCVCAYVCVCVCVCVCVYVCVYVFCIFFFHPFVD